MDADTSVLVFPGTNRARYEQQPDETMDAFHAFTHYRDMGPERSTDKAWREHKKDCDGKQQASSKRAVGSWTNWADKNGWVERAKAYDQELDSAKLSAQRSEAVEMGKRQAEQARTMADILAQPALSFARKVAEDPEAFEKMLEGAGPMQMAGYVNSVAQALATLAKLEREARGVGDTVAAEGDKDMATVKVVFTLDEGFRL